MCEMKVRIKGGALRPVARNNQELTRRIATLRAEVQFAREKSARITAALTMREQTLNRLLAEFAMCEAAAARTSDEC